MYIIVHESVPAGTLVQIAVMFLQEHFPARQPPTGIPVQSSLALSWMPEALGYNVL
jgi:hypothetical protein